MKLIFTIYKQLFPETKRTCFDTKSTVIYKALLLLFITALHSQIILSQDVVINEVVMGRAEVSSPTSVKMTAGFHVMEGSAFRAYINPLPPIQNSSYTVPVAPISGSTPITPSQTSNYVMTINYREPKASVPPPGTALKNLQEVVYFDGLGRPIQNIMVGASPSEMDIIQATMYDDYGREVYKPLAYAATDKTGVFRSPVDQTTISSYYSGGSLEGVEASGRAYTQIGYDNSPLNRVVSQTGPGDNWSDKPVTINYLTNDVQVQGWKVDNNGTFTSFQYQAYNLFVTETTDEDSNKSREYKDKQGKVVQKSSFLSGTWLNTLYIYDDLDLLRCVVPPKASNPNTDIELCYYYRYNGHRLMTEKRIPGGGITKMVYDKRDRLRCTQNSEQALAQEWSFIKYDEFNRPVITGIIKNYNSDALAVKTDLDAVTNLSETRNNGLTYYAYNNASFPTNNLTTEVQSVTYYDDYIFLDLLATAADSLKSAKFDAGDYNFTSKVDITPKGLVTGSLTRVLSSTTDPYVVPDNMLYSTIYYDKYNRVLRSISEDHLKGKYIVSNRYEDITSLVLSSKQQHYKGGRELKIEKTFEYDHAGRLLATLQKVNEQAAVTMNAMDYNETGQLLTKYLHSKSTSSSRSFIQKIDYRYNIRGWLTRINDPVPGENDLFGMQLYYNDVTAMGSLGGTGIFNGNISGIKWSIKNDVVTTRGYAFTYDDLNRLLSANYADGSTLGNNAGYYNETINEYDANGNIVRLGRKYDNILVDNLTYTYASGTNRILSIADAGTANNNVEDYIGNSVAYVYDQNGNMTTDGSRNLTLNYFNTLNLPKSVDFGNNNRIFYHYSSAGVKLLKHVKPQNGTDSYTHYIGNIIYENGMISYIITEEGRMINTGTNESPFFVYEYNLKDHLGNTRVTFLGSDLGGTVAMLQSNNYYPFGLNFTQNNYDLSTEYSKNKYLYNGKEIQDDKMNGTFFGMLDYGARFYDPQIGRWSTIDNKAEKYSFTSPYVYALNNPVVYIDPDGNEIIFIVRGETRQQDRQIVYSSSGSYWKDTGEDYDGTGGNSTIDRTLSAYKLIEDSNDEVLKNQLQTLECSDKTHWIEEASPGDGNHVFRPESEVGSMSYGDRSGTQTLLDFSEERKSELKRNNGVDFSDLDIITHEMRHQYDYDTGNMKDNTGEENARNPSEIRGVANENRARALEGNDKRTTYGGEQIDKNKLQNPPNF